MARVEVNTSLAFLHWVRITFHPWPFVSDIAVFVLKRDVKLQLTNIPGIPQSASSASGLLFPVIPEENFWRLVDQSIWRADIHLVTQQPSVSEHWRKQKALTITGLILSIYSWTPGGSGIAVFMLALWCQYQVSLAPVKGQKGVSSDIIHCSSFWTASDTSCHPRDWILRECLFFFSWLLAWISLQQHCMNLLS